MSDFSSLGIGLLFSGFIIAGFILLFNGVVQLRVRNKSGPWKEGGVSLLAGAIIAGVSIGMVLARMWIIGLFMDFMIAGLVLLFNGVVQISVRNKTGSWKEGGATLLAGAISAITGVSMFLAFSDGTKWLLYYGYAGLFESLIIAGLVLALAGVVQLCVRSKTGPWKEGGASLLAGAITTGVSTFLACIPGIKGVLYLSLFLGFITAGLVLALAGAVQLCVKNKTGLWKEGRATLLAGAIIVGVYGVFFVVSLFIGGV
jgi:uncharacterized membrane protein HdeD (DUF308 family)